MATVTKDDVVVARVLSEDKDFMILEVMKNESEVFHLDKSADNNRFFTLLFCQFNKGVASFKKPW